MRIKISFKKKIILLVIVIFVLIIANTFIFIKSPVIAIENNKEKLARNNVFAANRLDKVDKLDGSIINNTDNIVILAESVLERDNTIGIKKPQNIIRTGTKSNSILKVNNKNQERIPNKTTSNKNNNITNKLSENNTVNEYKNNSNNHQNNIQNTGNNINNKNTIENTIKEIENNIKEQNSVDEQDNKDNGIEQNTINEETQNEEKQKEEEPEKETPKESLYYIVEGDKKINISAKIKENKTFKNIEISEISIVRSPNGTDLRAKVKSINNEKINGFLVYLVMVNDKKEIMCKIAAYINSIRVGATTTIYTSSTFDFSNAYDLYFTD